ncbi:hypothetical protein SteCoe_32962 [Stentor coeruleus]|uniref:Uncharacterized protein n=1 Tax=Stentor coeruleus TaxID=5963 RepID=A0A1R2AXV7_9CILI|nr:hypothetical protein SteCoe_32962 [Stentor coeruleus]
MQALFYIIGSKISFNAYFSIISKIYIASVLILPLCIYGLLCYLAIENENEDIENIKKYFFAKTIIIILLTFEVAAIVICMFLIEGLFEDFFFLIGEIGASIVFDLALLYPVYICYAYLDTNNRREATGVQLAVESSEVISSNNVTNVARSIEIVMKEGIEDTMPCDIPPNEVVVHDFTLKAMEI